MWGGEGGGEEELIGSLKECHFEKGCSIEPLMSIRADFERCERFTLKKFSRLSWVVKWVSEHHPRFIDRAGII